MLFTFQPNDVIVLILKPPTKSVNPEHVSLKVPNIEFDFDGSVDCAQGRTVTLKSNLMQITHLHAVIMTQ